MTDATYAQHAVWFTEQATGVGPVHHMAVGVWFDGDLDVPALREACATVVARHPVLETAVNADGGALRFLPAAEKISMTCAELTDDTVREEVARPFSLPRGPLARFALLVGSPTRHLLLVTAHHLVFDGMSKDILVRELAAAYNATVAGRPIDDGTPAGAQVDRPADGHAAVERARVAAGLPAAKAYWESHFSAPGDVVLPGLDQPPSGPQPGADVDVEIGTELDDRIGRCATALGLTRFELLLAALHIVLARYGNAAMPVTVGLSTRTPETSDRIGLFVNELPLTVAPARGPFRGYAGDLRARLRELYRHRAVPIAHAVGGLRPTAALTPVAVSYRRRAETPNFAGVRGTVAWKWHNGVARTALLVQMVDGPAGLAISLQHPSTIDRDAVERIGTHLRTVLDEVVTDPDRDVAAVRVLPAAELDAVLRSVNATERAYPAAATVPGLFAQRVRERPGAVAVVDGAQAVSYAELDEASRRIAALLRRRGAGPGSLVAVSVGRSFEAVVALLAVLRAGAAYVPVDPAYPAPRRQLILADAEPALLLTTSTLAARLDAALPTVLLDGPDGVTGSHDPGDVDEEPPLPGSVAYVMYTSGSTGRPKGVAVPHKALANLLLAMRDLLGSHPDDRWLGLTSLSFDIAGLELYLPLITGARVVIAPEAAATDGAALLRLIDTQGVTHVQATPSGWRVLVDAGFGDHAAPGTSSVAAPVALVGGEALPAPLARELRERVTRLVNVYGPTETTIWSTAADIGPDVNRVTIGTPIANTRAYLLDAAMHPVPVGVPGELYLAGSGLADGYLRRPGLTADRFVPDPFGGPGSRLYRTGDVCHWLPDGRIAYRGRVDNQVKIRGHRVELGEIESRLLEHPAVAEGAVVLRGGSAGDADVRLVGYVVARGDAPEPAALREHLARTLPAVMVPAVWVFLDRLPLTPNGKLDRSALPDGPRARPVPVVPAVPAADPVVEQIRDIWQGALKIEEIGLDEDLFDLGGHSLTITKISNLIAQRLGVEVPLESFFDTPTIGEIADFVRDSLAASR